MASDAFFLFRDGIDAAAAARIRAVIQPGGSMRDKEVIAAAAAHDLAMAFTGVRHFRHCGERYLELPARTHSACAGQKTDATWKSGQTRAHHRRTGNTNNNKRDRS